MRIRAFALVEKIARFDREAQPNLRKHFHHEAHEDREDRRRKSF